MLTACTRVFGKDANKVSNVKISAKDTKDKERSKLQELNIG